MAATIIELQNQFAKELSSSMSSDWDSINVHYENMDVDGENYEIFTTSYMADGLKHQFEFNVEWLDILIALKRNQPIGQIEKWTWLEFILDRTGNYKFNYKYGIPPLIASELKYSGKQA